MLRDLDPHSTIYISKRCQGYERTLLGNFEGIGIQFNLLRDSIIVVEPISGGHQKRLDCWGDRIIKINGEKVTV